MHEEHNMQEQTMNMLERAKAFLSGHFRLSSGLHSGNYLQCAKAFELPEVSMELSRLLLELAGRKGIAFDAVISPALGGVILGYEVARQAGVKNIFAERDAENAMTLRRGFEILEGERYLVLEDVITTGGSTREIIELVHKGDATLSAVGCVADRSGGQAEFGVPLLSLVSLTFPVYSPESCPLCAQGVPIVKPGSKK